MRLCMRCSGDTPDGEVFAYKGQALCRVCYKIVNPHAFGAGNIQPAQGKPTTTPIPSSSVRRENPANKHPKACPDCGATSIAKMSVVYQSGTSTGGFAGVSFGGHGDVFSGISSSQSLLASQCAPPSEPRDGANAAYMVGVLFLIFTGIAAFTAVDVYTREKGLWWTIAGTCGFIGAACFAVSPVFHRAFKQERDVWCKAMERWERSWVCGICGLKFVWESP